MVVSHSPYSTLPSMSLLVTTPGTINSTHRRQKRLSNFIHSISSNLTSATLFSNISLLSHSYGVKFPVPEKRRKRLLQEMNDIEKNIRKKR